MNLSRNCGNSRFVFGRVVYACVQAVLCLAISSSSSWDRELCIQDTTYPDSSIQYTPDDVWCVFLRPMGQGPK